MPVNLSGETKEFSIMGKVWEFILRLLKVLTPEQLANGIQQVINDPMRRQTVADALTGRIAATVEMRGDRWVERELNVMNILGIEGWEETIRGLAAAGHFGQHKYFIPAGLTREQLIDLAGSVGIELHSAPNCPGDEILTEVGVLEYDLATIMQTTDECYRPFRLDYAKHMAYVQEQGGDNLTSVEEALYLIIRHFLTFGRILPVGEGCLRCQNCHSSVKHLHVGFDASHRLFIGHSYDCDWDWKLGAIPRKFTPLS